MTEARHGPPETHLHPGTFHCFSHSEDMPSTVAHSGAHPTGDKVAGSIPTRSCNILLWRFFSVVILSLPLIQEGLVSFWR